MVHGVQATTRSLFRVIRGGGTSDDWAEQLAESAEGDALAKAIEYWKSKGILPEGLLELLDPEFRTRGFSLAHQWDLDFLAEIYESLGRAIAEGKTFPDWMQEAQKTLDKFGAAPNAPRLADGPRWKPSYADLVYRQNTSNAFNAGRYAEMFSRKWVGKIPYWQFYAIEDSRNCPSGVCRALDGKVFEKGSGKARLYLPPLHFQCRCYTRELDPEDFKDGGYDVANPDQLRDAGVVPLKGFDKDSVEDLVPQVLRVGNLQP